MRLNSILLTALLGTSSLVHALEAKLPGPAWAEATRSNELIIFTRDDAGLHAREVQAVGEADAPPAAVYAVLADVGHYAEFMPYMKESRILRRISDTDMMVYERLAFPVISDRDFVVHRRHELGTAANGGVYRIRWQIDSEYFVQPVEGVVRLELSTGSWVLEPIDGGKRTRITYQVLTSPGGSVPNWISERSTTRAVPELFKVVKERAVRAAQSK
jgi:hypothetical protein